VPSLGCFQAFVTVIRTVAIFLCHVLEEGDAFAIFRIYFSIGVVHISSDPKDSLSRASFLKFLGLDSFEQAKSFVIVDV
jgi:hypothetical protein